MLLLVDESRLRETCDFMKTILADMKKIVTDLDQILYILGADWQGESEKIYYRKFISVKREYGNILHFFYLYEKELRNIVEEFVELENKNIMRIQKI